VCQINGRWYTINALTNRRQFDRVIRNAEECAGTPLLRSRGSGCQFTSIILHWNNGVIYPERNMAEISDALTRVEVKAQGRITSIIVHTRSTFPAKKLRGRGMPSIEDYAKKPGFPQSYVSARRYMRMREKHRAHESSHTADFAGMRISLLTTLYLSIIGDVSNQTSNASTSENAKRDGSAWHTRSWRCRFGITYRLRPAVPRADDASAFRLRIFRGRQH
jgi:hypothetical protein